MASDAVKYGIGAAGGGLTTGLFASLGIPKLLESGSGFSAGYPIIIFSMAALFLLLSGAYTMQIIKEQRAFAFLGAIIFGVIALAGVGVVYGDDWRRPPTAAVTLSEDVTPSMESFHDPDISSAPVAMQVDYRIRREGPQFNHLDTGNLQVRDNDVVDIRLTRLDDLFNRYSTLVGEKNDLKKVVATICKQQPSFQLCVYETQEQPTG